VISSANGSTRRRSWPEVRERRRRQDTGCAKYHLLLQPRTFLRREDSDFVVFCFSKLEDAVAFAKRFGGELWVMASGAIKKGQW
jgi:hypothetical protein